jgi:hypothetical protein
MNGYYKSKENIAHTDDLIERVLKDEIIDVIEYEESFECTSILYWRFGVPEPVELTFANKTIKEVEHLYFEKI